MKKIIGVAAGTLVVIIVGIFMFNTAHETDTDVTKNQTKVGVLLNGTRDDKSWGQSHVEGLTSIEDELNLKLVIKENVPQDEQCVPVMEELIRQGCKIIICDSYEYEAYEYPLAEKYPEIYFFHASGVQSSKNYISFFGRIYQMRYLSGIVAGLQTKTGKIGYVAAMDISEVNRGLNAFTLGVRSVNPDAQVYVRRSGSWNGEEITADAARALLGQYPDIDVMGMHTDAQAVLELCEERGIWSVGYNIDNSELYPNTFLTAPVWKWENFYKPHILACLQGKSNGGHYWEGIESGIMALAPLTSHVKEETRRKVEEADEKLKSGTFDVFYGPIYDNQGKLRVLEGENLSDEILLNAFDWYVEGVVISE